MLKRTLLRRYLLAILYSDEVFQSPDCEKGPLFVNCDGERPDVFDSYTHQVFEDAEGNYNLQPESIGVVFNIERLSYTLSPTEIESVNLVFRVDIIAHANNGKKRQDILDIVEERILYRLFSYQTIQDASTGENLRSFMYWIDNNTLTVESRDDSSFDGNYTIRELTFTMQTNECIKKTGCGDTPICFDFSKLGVCEDG